MYDHVLEYSCVDEGDNLSDHLPVKLVASLPSISHVDDTSERRPSKPLRHAATRTNIKMYQRSLDDKLGVISIPRGAIKMQ